MTDELSNIIKKSYKDIENKNYKSAFESLYPKLEDYPDNLELITQIAHCYYKMGETSQAEEYYEKAFDINNNSTLVLDPLVDLKIELEKYNEAEKYAKHYLDCEDKVYATQKYLETLALIKHYEGIEDFAQKVDPENLNSASYSILSNAYIELIKSRENTTEEIEKAIFYAQKSIELDKNNIDAACVLAKCYIENKDYDKIEELYKNTPNAHVSSIFLGIYAYKKFADKNYNAAIEFFSKALELDETNEILYFNLAESYMQIGWLNEAEVIVKKGLALNENNVNLRLSLANIYYMGKEYDKTLLTLAFVNELEPENIEMNLLYAYTYGNQNNFAKANEYAKKLEGKVDSSVIDCSFARIYYNLGQKEKAYEIFDDVISRNPDNIEILADKADHLIYDKEYEKALEIYDKILEINPNYVDAYYEKSIICYRAGNKEDALNYAKIAVENDCNNASYQFNLGLRYADNKEYDKAIDCIKFSLAMTPDDTEKYNTIGWLYLEKGDVESALSYYKEVLAIDQNNFDELTEIAHSLECHNQYEKAYEYYKMAFRVNPYDYDYIRDYSNFVTEHISVYDGIMILLNFSKYSTNKNLKIESKNRAKRVKKENLSKLNFKQKLSLMFK